MDNLLKKLKALVKDEIYCIFDTEYEYVVTSYTEDKAYIIDKELEYVKQTNTYDPETAFTITHAKMIYCAEPTNDIDVFDADY